jgi:hypothetical protein
MSELTGLDRNALPTNRQLIAATIIAVAVAAVVLVTAVLPAEYAIDPTGIGHRLGLTAMSAGARANDPLLAEMDPAFALAPATARDAVWKSAVAPRGDRHSLTLRPGEAGEIKADMRAGDRFVFSWNAEGGSVSFDMHGDKPGAAGDGFTTYWKGRDAREAHGAFEAPFAGRHGWYWRNRGDKPVTITVSTSGFYDKLYRTAGPPASHGSAP